MIKQFKIIQIDTFPLWNEPSPLYPWRQGWLSDSLIKNRAGKWKTIIVQWRNSANSVLTQWWWSTSPMIQWCHVGTMSSQIWGDKQGTSTLWYFSSKLITTNNLTNCLITSKVKNSLYSRPSGSWKQCDSSSNG